MHPMHQETLELNCSRTSLALDSTMAVAVEMSLSTWLVCAEVPGLDRRVMKKMSVNGTFAPLGPNMENANGLKTERYANRPYLQNFRVARGDQKIRYATMRLDPGALVQSDPRSHFQDALVVLFEVPGEDRLMVGDPVPESA